MRAILKGNVAWYGGGGGGGGGWVCGAFRVLV